MMDAQKGFFFILPQIVLAVKWRIGRTLQKGSKKQEFNTTRIPKVMKIWKFLGLTFLPSFLPLCVWVCVCVYYEYSI